MAKTDQYKILFPLTPNLIGSVSTNVSSMTSCLRHWQEPAKTVHGDFQIWTCSRTMLSKNEI